MKNFNNRLKYLLIAISINFSLLSFSQTKKGTLTIKSPNGPRIENGKKLYIKNCSTCHSEGSRRITANGLMGMTDKYEMGWLYKWVTNYRLLIESKDSLAIEVSKRSGGAMTLFPFLTLKEVEDIYMYVDYFNKSKK